jgi:hypothetical protein
VAARGADNAAVMRELLGMDDDAVAALVDQGIISANMI